MIVSRVTPPAEEEGAEVDGAEGVGGAADSNRLKRSCTFLLLTVAVCTHNMEVTGNGKGNRKMVRNLHDSRREDELITGRYILIYIYDGNDEMREKI